MANPSNMMNPYSLNKEGGDSKLKRVGRNIILALKRGTYFREVGGRGKGVNRGLTV